MGASALHKTSTKKRRKVKKTNVSTREPVQAAEISGHRDVGARALYNTSTKRQRKVKRTSVSIRDPVQAGEMWERGPYTVLTPKDEEKSKRLLYHPKIQPRLVRCGSEGPTQYFHQKSKKSQKD